VYNWQIPGEEGGKKIWERISTTGQKVAEFSSEKKMSPGRSHTIESMELSLRN
jgi:hypothetical protein